MAGTVGSWSGHRGAHRAGFDRARKLGQVSTLMTMSEDEVNRRIKEIREDDLIEELRQTAERLTRLADRLEVKVSVVEGINDATGPGKHQSGAGRKDDDPRGPGTVGSS